MALYIDCYVIVTAVQPIIAALLVGSKKYSPPRGALRAHVDCVPGWILVVSLGATAIFWFEQPVSKENFLPKDFEETPRKPRQVR